METAESDGKHSDCLWHFIGHTLSYASCEVINNLSYCTWDVYSGMGKAALTLRAARFGFLVDNNIQRPTCNGMVKSM